MKHFLLFLLILLTVSSAVCQSGPDLTIGAKAGINIYGLSSDALVEEDDAGLGYEFGIYGRIGQRFFVQPELNFVSHKLHLITLTQTRVGERDALTVRYFRLPVLFGYRTRYEGPVVSRVRLMVGPSVSYAISVADNNINIGRSDIHNVQFAVNGGAGFEVWKLHLDLLYHHYITHLFNDGRSDGRARAISVSAGIGF